jgi:hypothetical protein
MTGTVFDEPMTIEPPEKEKPFYELKSTPSQELSQAM